MRFEKENNSSINASDLIGTNIKEKKLMLKKLHRRENNANHEEDCGGICLSRIQYLPLSSLSGSTPGNVRWCPSLALGSLFETASDPQSVAVSF